MSKENESNKISVIIPMYNSEKTIERALTSVVNQTYKGAIEIIVVNDGSKDNSQKKVENFINKHPNFDIKLINQQNGGVSKARNTGLKSAIGNYIALLDSDDEWLPKKIEEQIVFFKKPNVDFITALRNNDKITFPYSITDDNYAIVTLKKLLFKVVGHTSTAVFKRSVLDEIGYFDENQKYSEDANFWMKVSVKFNIIILNQVLVITGGGKPSIGHSGLSANVKEMEKGAQKNLNEMYNLHYVNFIEFFLLKVFSKIKYLRRIVLIKMNKVI